MCNLKRKSMNFSYTTLAREWKWKLQTSYYYSENSFDLEDTLRGNHTSQAAALKLHTQWLM